MVSAQPETRPDWVRVYDETNEHLKDLEENVVELKRKQTQRLKVKFSSEDKILDKQIAGMMSEIYKALSTCEKNVKSIVQFDYLTKPVEKIIQENVKQTLAQKVQSFTRKLRRQEKDYYTRRKDIDSEEGDIIKNSQILNDQLSREEQLEFENMEKIAYSKDVEINNIVKSINDLAVLFKELSELVIDQGNILDRIDYNIEQAVRNTKKGKGQLVKVTFEVRIGRGAPEDAYKVVHRVLGCIHSGHDCLAGH
eukprot:TRINITY_DN2113_c0_g1_i2.p1 TRINITY_DN2113_c0_g1~~TRINITY_DN2113_c0_g1_i2.p1  ORF type:complete len:252 (-),score=73.06 TRINITY_DN2113_c0_g1_i2:176-931(-)